MQDKSLNEIIALHREFIQDLANDIERKDLNEIRSLNRPPDRIFFIIRIAATLLENDKELMDAEFKTCMMIVCSDEGRQMMKDIDIVSINRDIVDTAARLLLDNNDVSFKKLESTSRGALCIRLWIDTVIKLNKLYR